MTGERLAAAVAVAALVVLAAAPAALADEADEPAPMRVRDESADVGAALSAVDDDALDDPRGTGYVVEIVDPFRMEVVDVSKTSLGLVDDEVLDDPRGHGFVVDLVATRETLEGDELAVGVEEHDEGTITLGGDVFFAFDEAALTDSAREYLAELAPLIRERGEGIDEPVRIEGHTDDVGETGYNQQLSERRAASVRDHLVDALGLGDLAFEVAGYGETQPVTPNRTGDGADNPDGRARNRRVEIRFASTSEDTAPAEPEPVPE